MRLFRIDRKNLYRLWAWTGISAALVFLLLAWLDYGLRSRTGLGTYDLQKFSTAAQYRAVLDIWIRPDIAMWGGFNLGLDYLFMPLYATALFCSGLVVQDVLKLKMALLQRVVSVATLIQPVGALFDVIENGLQFYLLNLARADDTLAQLAFRISNLKMMCFYAGVALLMLALFSLRMRKAEKKLQL